MKKDEGGVTAKAEDRDVHIIAGRRLDADVAAQRLRKARHLQHDAFVRDQRTDAARAGLRQVDGAEQLLRGHGEAAGHACSSLPSAVRNSSRSTERPCSRQPAAVSMRTVPRAIAASASPGTVHGPPTNTPPPTGCTTRVRASSPS